MASPSVAQRIREILAGPHRSAEDRARDAARRPLETLTFFGIHPDMTVVEIWPFFGWYSKIIAPLVKESGRFIAAVFPPDNKQAYMNQQRQDYIDLLAAHPGRLRRAPYRLLRQRLLRLRAARVGGSDCHHSQPA